MSRRDGKAMKETDLQRVRDPDLFDAFVKEKVYLKYADQFLDPAQIDAVDEAALTG